MILIPQTRMTVVGSAENCKAEGDKLGKPMVVCPMDAADNAGLCMENSCATCTGFKNHPLHYLNPPGSVNGVQGIKDEFLRCFGTLFKL